MMYKNLFMPIRHAHGGVNDYLDPKPDEMPRDRLEALAQRLDDMAEPTAQQVKRVDLVALGEEIVHIANRLNPGD